MSTFEALKLAYLRSTQKEEPGVLALLAFGSVSGSVGATSVYPLNLVRTRLQASGSSGHPQKYTGVMDVVQRTYARDGWRGFYRGLFPTLAKVRVPLFGLAWYLRTLIPGRSGRINIVRCVRVDETEVRPDILFTCIPCSDYSQVGSLVTIETAFHVTLHLS